MIATSTWGSDADAVAAVRARLVRDMPRHFDRLTWSAERLAEVRTTRLRTLLTVALERSPFHARRLDGLDPATFGLDDLASLPPMTKAEMMADLDAVVTDRRLTAAGIERHLATVAEDPRLHLGEYVVMASGGSSGLRGVYVYRHAAAAEYVAAVLRPGMAGMAAVTGWPPPAPAPLTVVAAPVSVHATRILPALVDGAIATVTYAPATLAFEEIVRRVQASRPLVLTGYATTIARLADARAAGDLDIEPLIVQVTSEQLTADLVERITRGFGAPPANSFASSEGLIGSAPPGTDVFDFASDLAIVEPVDADDRPVAAGTEAHHVLVTNLFNLAQPLIRYRLDDAMAAAPAAGGHGHQRARVQGRRDEQLHLADAVVHPLVVRSAVLRQPAVVDFRVRAAGRAVEVDLVVDGAVDAGALAATLSAAFADAGAAAVEVTCRVVDAIPRDPRSGKAKRFESITAEQGQGGVPAPQAARSPLATT